MNNNNFKLITLNVGGKIFTTYYDTLKRSSYFQELIQNKKAEQAIAIQNGAQQKSFFIDRDGDIFEAIMHYLRSCNISVKTSAELKKLKNEAAFFKFDELVMKADQALYASECGDNEGAFEIKRIEDVINEIKADTLGALEQKQHQILYKYSYYSYNEKLTKSIVEK